MDSAPVTIGGYSIRIATLVKPSYRHKSRKKSIDSAKSCKILRTGYGQENRGYSPATSNATSRHQTKLLSDGKVIKDEPVSKTIVKLQTATDRRWGYPYGVDGLVPFEKAQDLLGGMSRTSIERHIKAGELRRGGKGKIYFCKRALFDFIRSMEK